jgi:hypothetical protein
MHQRRLGGTLKASFEQFIGSVGLRPRQSPEAAMALFPESASLGWVIGVGIAAALGICVVIALIARSWPRKER